MTTLNFICYSERSASVLGTDRWEYRDLTGKDLNERRWRRRGGGESGGGGRVEGRGWRERERERAPPCMLGSDPPPGR